MGGEMTVALKGQLEGPCDGTISVLTVEVMRISTRDKTTWTWTHTHTHTHTRMQATLLKSE